ncbi:GyrI-like domain-containing protein [Flammeovirga yaeyamensis]|nr:GyrI-like domain-containing protein [Flammeovirga yaeyamensis]
MKMKFEWRKKEKTIYQPKTKPEIIDVPEYQFIVISGEGNPNSDFFQECIGALYSVAYAIKMTMKKLDNPPSDYIDWTVYPLEGVWDINDEAKKNFNGQLNKDDLVFDLMIRQPDFISKEFFDEILELTKKKKPNPLLEQLRFEKITDGKCIQLLHMGSYDDEPASFELMEQYAGEMKVKRKSKIHREIYLSDFRKVPTEKLKTVLRFQLEE